jgi:hypothetical protein
VAESVLPKLSTIAPLVEALDQLLVSPNAVAIEHRYYPEYDMQIKFQELVAAGDLVAEG